MSLNWDAEDPVGNAFNPIKEKSDMGKCVPTLDYVYRAGFVKDLPTVGAVHGQQFSVAGFYKDSPFGGGLFVYDAGRSKADHNGGTVIAPEALLAWDGTVNTLAGYLSWTGGGLGVYVKKWKIKVSPEEFGAIGDGVVDDTAPLVSLGNALKGGLSKVHLLQTYKVAANVKVYNDIDCEGELHLYGSARLDILRESAGIDIDATPYMANLVKGGLSIGVPNIAGHTVSLRSTEVLIKRFGFSQHYNKEEVFKVESNNGLGWPRLDCTYLNAAQLTMIAYPPERELEVNGLKVRGFQTTLNADLVHIRRSNIVLNDFDLDVELASRLNVRMGVDIRDSVDVIFNRPRVHGVMHQQIGSAWFGYGFHLWRTANVFINDANSNECKHNVTGRHDKDTYINGGWFRSGNGSSSPLDSHWTNGFHVKGATVYARGANGLGVAGSNVSFIDNTVYDGRRLVGVRTDTPELGGSVVIEDNTWNNHPTADGQSFYGTVSAGEEYGSFFEREIMQPDYLGIKRNTISNAFNGELGYLRLHNRNWSRKFFGFIDIADNKVISGSKVSGLMSERANLIIPSLMSIPEGSTIRCCDEVWERSNGNFKIRNDKGTLENLLTIHLDEVQNVSFQVDVDVASSFKVKGGSVNYFKAASSVPTIGQARSVNYDIELEGTRFLSPWTYYATAPQLRAVACHFEASTSHNPNDFVPGGNVQLLSSSMKDAFKLSMANTCAESANVNQLPQLNGWVIGDKQTSSLSVVKSGGDFSLAELGPLGLGVRVDSKELQLNVGGEVLKAALMGGFNFAPYFNRINTFATFQSSLGSFPDTPTFRFRFRTGNVVPRQAGFTYVILSCHNTTTGAERQFMLYVNTNLRLILQLGGTFTGASSENIMPNTVYDVSYDGLKLSIKANGYEILEQNIVFGPHRQAGATWVLGAGNNGSGGYTDRYVGEIMDFENVLNGHYWAMSDRSSNVQDSLPLGNLMTLHNFTSDLWRLQ